MLHQSLFYHRHCHYCLARDIQRKLGVPAKLSAKGAARVIELELSTFEQEAFGKWVVANTELMNIARGFLS